MKLNTDKGILTQKERSSPLLEKDFEINVSLEQAAYRTRTTRIKRKIP